MLNVMADIIWLDDPYKADRFDDETLQDQFIDAIFLQMETIEDERVRNLLTSIDREKFQEWIDDPRYGEAIDYEIDQRKEVKRGITPGSRQGRY